MKQQIEHGVMVYDQTPPRIIECLTQGEAYRLWLAFPQGVFCVLVQNWQIVGRGTGMESGI